MGRKREAVETAQDDLGVVYYPLGLPPGGYPHEVNGVVLLCHGPDGRSYMRHRWQIPTGGAGMYHDESVCLRCGDRMVMPPPLSPQKAWRSGAKIQPRREGY